MVSLRQLRPVPWYGGMVDAENALVETLDATRHDVVLRPGRTTERLFGFGAASRVMSLSRIGRPFVLDPAPDPRHRADLLVIMANDLHDLALATCVEDWHHLGDVVMVCIAEISDRHLRIYGDVVQRIARHVDHVFIGTSIVPQEHFRRGRVATTGSILPLADVLRFPSRAHREREIDVLHFGRRNPVQHRFLREWADETGGFYLYDTGTLPTVWDLDDHRSNFVNVATRSRVIVTNHARFDEGTTTRFDRILGTRFVEAAAAGAVLCGERPFLDDPAFTGLVDDLPIVALPFHARELSSELTDLLADRCASDEVGRVARRIALERLDFAHQWERMMSQAGLPVAEGIIERQTHLRSEAARLV